MLEKIEELILTIQEYSVTQKIGLSLIAIILILILIKKVTTKDTNQKASPQNPEKKPTDEKEKKEEAFEDGMKFGAILGAILTLIYIFLMRYIKKVFELENTFLGTEEFVNFMLMAAIFSVATMCVTKSERLYTIFRLIIVTSGILLIVIIP